MARALVVLMIAAMIAGCASTSPSTALSEKNARCKGMSWSWCTGYHGGR